MIADDDRRGSATRPVVVFPSAGSFGSEFRSLLREMRPQVTRARYPGRSDDEPAASFGDLVARCVEQVVALGDEAPVLLGHSFGAYVAFATALELERTRRPVSSLVVLGATAPPELDLDALPADTPEDVAAYLTRIDPTSLTGAPSDEWRDLLVEVARADLRLLRGHGTRPGDVLTCPIVAVRGEADSLVSEDGLAAWRQATRGEFTQHVVPGQHADPVRALGTAPWFRPLTVTG